MTSADIDRLSKGYAAGEARGGRLGKALRVDLPVWRELSIEILGDLDERIFGVGWWAPHPGTSRRILISDHLFSCARSVETNLIEARLHLMEAMDFWERESDFHARTVTLRRDGNVDVQLPERKRPSDDVQLAIATLHTVGFIRAIAGAMDCFGGVIVGVTALKVRLLRADLDNARRTLGRIAGASAGERAQREFSERLEAAIGRSGPPGWLRWAIDLRNTPIHRGRRLEMSELRPVPSGIVGLDGRPVIRTEVIRQLPRDPGRSDVEMFLDMSLPPVLSEDAAMTPLGVLESTLRFLEESGMLLRDLWRARRADPTLLLQPREQWPDGPSLAPTGFPGYAPDSVPYNPTQLRSDEVLIRRMIAASLGPAEK